MAHTGSNSTLRLLVDYSKCFLEEKLSKKLQLAQKQHLISYVIYYFNDDKAENYHLYKYSDVLAFVGLNHLTARKMGCHQSVTKQELFIYSAFYSCKLCFPVIMCKLPYNTKYIYWVKRQYINKP